MDNILYIFITHQNNIDNIYDRIKIMMNSFNNSNYILVKGGEISNNYDIDTKILSINCNGMELDFEKSKEEKIKPAINVMTLRMI